MAAWLSLPERAVLRLLGPEALDFLDKLATQDLSALKPGGCAYAALLSPQGKILSDFFVWRAGDEELLLDAPAARAEALLARLRLMKLRAKLEIAPAQGWRAAASVEEAPLEFAAPDPRLPALGWRGVTQAPLAAAEPSALRTSRIALGVPDLAEDCGPEEIFALEGLLEELNGVSFKKGCFPGQENVSRMKRRATTRKKFCPLRTEGEAPLGAPVLAGAVELGVVRAAIPGTALALLRLDRALEAGPLSIAGREAVLQPPAWLILPATGSAED